MGLAGGGRELREVRGVGACGRMDYSDVHQGDVSCPFTQYNVLDNERHKAMCELRGISVGALCEKYDYIDIYPEFMWAVGQAIGLRDGAGFGEIISRLIYLLGGDQSHDSSSMRQENETENPRTEQYVLDTSKAKTIWYESDALIITDGKHEARIVKGDVILDGVSFMDTLNETINKAMRGKLGLASDVCESIN